MVGGAALSAVAMTRTQAALSFAPSLLAGAVGWVWLPPAAWNASWPWLLAMAAGLAAGVGIITAEAFALGYVRSLKRLAAQTRTMLKRMPLATWQLVALTSVGAVGEEVLFRGVLLPAIGLVPQALIFGLLHPSFDRRTRIYPVLAFLMGLAFGALSLTGGGLWAAATAHAAVNTAAVLQARR